MERVEVLQPVGPRWANRDGSIVLAQTSAGWTALLRGTRVLDAERTPLFGRIPAKDLVLSALTLPELVRRLALQERVHCLLDGDDAPPAQVADAARWPAPIADGIREPRPAPDADGPSYTGAS